MTTAIEQARLSAASAIVSNARIEAKQIIARAEQTENDIIRRAHTHANRIENSAREYAATLNPDRPKPDMNLYNQLRHERYGRRSYGNSN